MWDYRLNVLRLILSDIMLAIYYLLMRSTCMTLNFITLIIASSASFIGLASAQRARLSNWLVSSPIEKT